MSLSAGIRLGPYQIIAPLGAGAMGEVWKALDTTLDREVAIKLLPAAFSGDRERITRLEREAKLLASLNHPNVAAIYGFPEAELSSTGGQKVRFLAMELVRGEDLAQILSRGPMPIADVLDAAKQIATALEAAHDNGVIHRDLKPANIKRTPERQVKVLDFGLAKALETARPDAGSSVTMTSPGSAAGLIVGTASYMSPEQARGQAVDRRTDLWAFGCVLYEMLTGVRAFDGATVTDVLVKVVSGEPDWEKLPVETPRAVRRLLRRCLEKETKRRLRDAGDASLLLEDNPEDARPIATPRPRPAKRTLLAAMAIGIAIAGASIGWWIGHRGAGDTKTASSVAFRRVTFARGMMRSARFAPDGSTIVYGAAWEGPPTKLYLSRTESPETAPIALPPAELLSISKTGEMAVALDHAYYGWMAEGTLARTSLLGGAPREILEHVRAADWSPDGSQLAVVRRVEGYDQLEYPIGTVLDKTTGYFGDVHISPDGERLAYTDHPSWGDNRGHLAVVDRAGKKTTLSEYFYGIQGVAWARGGKEVWYTGYGGAQGTRLHATDLAGHSRVVYSSIGTIELLDIAEDGRVLLGSQQPQKEVLAFLAGFDEPRLLLVPGESSQGSISVDGRAVLISNHLPDEYETFVVRSDQPGALRLSSGNGLGISPDGAWAITADASFRTLFVTPLGMGPTRTVPNPDQIAYESSISWLPDSKRFVVVGRRGSDPSQGFVCDVETGAGRPFGAPGVEWTVFTPPPVSPDGKYVVLLDAEGTPKRWPVDGGEPLPIPGWLAEDQQLTFTEDGAALFVAGRSLPLAIERLDLTTGERAPWLTVAPSDASGLRFAVVTISPNGKYWALSTAKLLTDLYVVEGLR